jgi:hypothetical protein
MCFEELDVLFGGWRFLPGFGNPSWRPRSILIFIIFFIKKLVFFETVSSLGRYVFGSEISYNKAPPRLPGLGC